MVSSPAIKPSFTLFDVIVDHDEAKRIDNYRVGTESLTALYPATLTDGGNAIEAVAKVRKL